MAANCIFCKIIQGEIPSQRVIETDSAIVIRDIQPQAPKHLLVIPKQHVVSLDDLFSKESGSSSIEVAGSLLSIAHQAAKQEGLLPDGFRTVINTGSGGGQTVFHLHVHVLGGGGLSGSFG